MGGYSESYASSSSYDFDRAPSVTKRTAKSYAAEDKRVYTPPKKGLDSPVGKDIKSDSPYSAVLVVDVTGSMKDWPGLIFEKIPTLYAEANSVFQGAKLSELTAGRKLEDKLELAVIAVGDARTPDRYPIQVVDFSKRTDLVKGVHSIFPEGGGGSFGRESYELVAYYLDKHCETPNVPKGAKPLLVFACDEDFYLEVDKDEVKKHIGDTLQRNRASDEVIESIAKKFDTYVLRPEPGAASSDPVYVRAQEHWESLLGAQRVLKMENPGRLVDCFIGICGYSASNFDNAKDLLERRQTPGQVTQVLETLHPLLMGEQKGKRKAKKLTTD